MTAKEPKQKNNNGEELTTIQFINVKILPPTKGRYDDLIQRIFNSEIIHSQSKYNIKIKSIDINKEYNFISGCFIHYSTDRVQKVFDVSSNEIEEKPLDEDDYLNPKEVRFVFVPRVHRLAFEKITGVPNSKIANFLKYAVKKLIITDNNSSNERVKIHLEAGYDTIHTLLNLTNVVDVNVKISYTNDDFTKDFTQVMDEKLRQDNAQNVSIKAKASKDSPMSVTENGFLKSALELSKSNGQAEVQYIQDGNIKCIKTTDHPQEEVIRSSKKSFPFDVYKRIIDIFGILR